MATEESLPAISTEQIVPTLARLLNWEHNPDIMLLSARAITHLLDVMPSSASAVIRSSIVTSLCNKLLNIEYIDVAEQSLQVLLKP